MSCHVCIDRICCPALKWSRIISYGMLAGLSTQQTANCTVTHKELGQSLEACQIDVDGEGLPIPVWPLAAFPEVDATLRHSFQAFLDVQARYNASDIQLGKASV